MKKWKNSPQKKFQEKMIPREWIKRYINKISELEFIIIVIRLIAGIEKSIEDAENILL